MYKLDSGIVSIIATIAAIIIGVYSAIDGKQKEKKRRAALKRGHGDDNAPDEHIFNDPFDSLFGSGQPQEGGDRFVPEERKRGGSTLDFYIDEDGELFSFASGAGDGDREIVETEVARPADRQAPVVYKTVEESMATQPVYDNGMESIENSGLSLSLAEVKGDAGSMRVPDANRELSLPGLRERVKLNPKDLILFSEILKPKYKDF